MNSEEREVSKLKAYFLELRAPFLTASISPVLLGTAIAWALTGIFLIDVFLLTLIAGVCLHIGANVSNDYFDHTTDNTGSDDINTEFVRPFTGGSRMIQLGYLSPREVLTEAFVFFGIAGAIGVYLAFTRGFLILVLGIIGAGSGFFYTAPPFRFVKRGIGEVFIGLNFGVLMTFGSYYVQALDIALEPILASVPTALLIAAVLYINEFPDFIADRDSGKRTIVVRLGRARAAKGYALIIAITFSWIVICVLMQLISYESLLALTLLPIGYVGVRTALKEYDTPNRMVPANAATVLLHLLITLYLTSAYILKGFMVDFLILIVAGVIMLLICFTQYRTLIRPPPA
ncbi:MAG: 1,4-dihydroxy-2-naphthoate octaprenyltransferase [Candidatus Thorarchaeota archaeon]